MAVDATPDRIAIWHHAVSASDEQLRSAIEDELQADSGVNADDITVSVAGGIITLTGIIRSPSERTNLLAAVHRRAGIQPVHDMVAIRHTSHGSELRRSVRDAINRSFHRSADIDTANIDVDCDHGIITLTGRVHSLAARISAENAAWSTPGVTHVDNNLLVGSHDPTAGG
jgi:osmotically-inducible protein OsmY